VQFHPEVNAEILAQMFVDVGTPSDVADEQVRFLRSRAADQRADSLRLFDRFWGDVS
jgi:hypothetical protein